jgi:hypothetical protein
MTLHIISATRFKVIGAAATLVSMGVAGSVQSSTFRESSAMLAASRSAAAAARPWLALARRIDDLTPGELQALRTAIRHEALGLHGHAISGRMAALLCRINFGVAVSVEKARAHGHPRVRFVWGAETYASSASDVRAHFNWVAGMFRRRAAYLAQ